MPFDRFFEELPPNARVAVALVPFLLALVARLLFGKNHITQSVLWLATMWFTLSVMMAPFSLELPNLRRIF
ncbi:MAG TPA: hypothetical protein VG096_24910 [Bryobacteraceae bacterium]|jgi:hypothetical protein|nr:hypothetical protein [Bryobacteraceae bacterium]